MAITNIQNIAPSFQSLLSGSGTYYPTYAFICSSFTTSPTAGATYINNSVTFTVTQVVNNVIYATAINPPTSSGTLAKASGTGDSSIAFAGYAKPKKLEVEMVGAGGGGGSGCTVAANNGIAGTTGGVTTFGTSLLTANGGVGGAGNNTEAGGIGGTATVNSPAITIIAVQGGYGNPPGAQINIAANYVSGGNGGSSPYGGAGAGGPPTLNGNAAAANSGSGGGGAGTNQLSYSGAGGGTGGYINASVINSSTSVYAFVVGVGGPGGSQGSVGGAGGSGVISIKESFSY